MCVDAANCDGSCPECMSNKIRRLKMANKKLTKMCDQYLAELAAERQRARMPTPLLRRLREWDDCCSTVVVADRLLRDILAWYDREE